MEDVFRSLDFVLSAEGELLERDFVVVVVADDEEDAKRVREIKFRSETRSRFLRSFTGAVVGILVLDFRMFVSDCAEMLPVWSNL